MTTTTAASMGSLYESLQRRYTPEQIAKVLYEVCPGSDPELRAALYEVANNRYYYFWAFSAMPTLWDAPTSLSGPANVLAELIGRPSLTDEQARNPEALSELLDEARRFIGAPEPPTSFKYERLNREQRYAQGLTMSRRRYDKLFRLVTRLTAETDDLTNQWRLARLGRVAKTAFAHLVASHDFEQDWYSAAFVAYMTATLGRRSLFTNASQPRAFDVLSDMLLMRCGPESSWFAIAHVFPRADVLAHLTEMEKMALLDVALGALYEAGEIMRAAAEKDKLNLETMVVHRGNDSSTWNAASGAWNKCRDFWLSLLAAFGLDDTLDESLPGKALRLMAGDVTAWHQSSGQEFHPDTYVWRDLPKPWEVLLGQAACSRADVEEACRRHGVDPLKSGWSVARDRTVVAPLEPTPETVHGVSVDHPLLGQWLRRVGAFSGQGVRQSRVDERPAVDYTVARDADGFVTEVRTGTP